VDQEKQIRCFQFPLQIPGHNKYKTLERTERCPQLLLLPQLAASE